MLLYVINVEACIHEENYRIFFYEPAAKRQLEVFDAAWKLSSLSQAFCGIAAHINRRGFEKQDFQVIVCVRRREGDCFKDTTLYARALIAQALERSGTIPVITASYTRKVTVLFQVEQAYYGTVPQIAVWEEELTGLNRFLACLQTDDLPSLLTDSLGNPVCQSPQQWEEALCAALEVRTPQEADAVTRNLKDRLQKSLEEERELERQLRLQKPENGEESALREAHGDRPGELPEQLSARMEEEVSEQANREYISHRLRSLLDGSGINRCSEVIYWPVARESSRASCLCMLSLVELICTGQEVTRSRVEACFVENHPDYEKQLLARFSHILAGYRYQLQEKLGRMLQEQTQEPQREDAKYPLENGRRSTIPEPSPELSEHLEHLCRQLESSRVSLQKSRRTEITERVSQISQSLTEAVDGLEEELAAYEKAAVQVLYREIEGSTHTGFGVLISPCGIQRHKDRLDEQEAKRRISQWQQDMQLLTKSSRLSGGLSTVLYFLGMTALVMIPYLLYQGLGTGKNAGSGKAALLSGLCCMGAVLLFTGIRRLRMPGCFIRCIYQSFLELEQRLQRVAQCYRQRAEEYRAALEAWLEKEQELQREKEQKGAKQEEKQLAAMRAWHLSHIRRTLDSLETFSFLEGEAAGTEDPELEKRILQPMDYRKRELGNEIYWPVMTGKGDKGDE